MTGLIRGTRGALLGSGLSARVEGAWLGRQGISQNSIIVTVWLQEPFHSSLSVSESRYCLKLRFLASCMRSRAMCDLR